MKRDGMNRKRSAVFVLVAMLHLWLIVICLKPGSIKTAPDGDSSPLILLYLPPPAPPATLVSEPKSTSQSTLRLPKPEPLGAPVPGDHVPLPAAPQSADAPGIDWSDEQSQVARAQAESIFKELKRTCHEAELRGESPPECHRYRRADAWSPEPRKFGIEGGLPYMRLGKRCIVGLGFFGCAVGALPQANGHAFDDMRDPDRPWSSVPDPNER